DRITRFVDQAFLGIFREHCLDAQRAWSPQAWAGIYTRTVEHLAKEIFGGQYLALAAARSRFLQLATSYITDYELRQLWETGDSKTFFARCRTHFSELRFPIPTTHREVCKEEDHTTLMSKSFAVFRLRVKELVSTSDWGPERLQDIFHTILSARYLDFYFVRQIAREQMSETAWAELRDYLHPTVAQMLFRHRYLRERSDENASEIEGVFTVAMKECIRNVRNGTYQGDAALKTYFFTIFNGRCIDWIRKEQKREGAPAHEPSEPSWSPGAYSWELAHDIDHYKSILLRQIPTLGKKCKHLLLAIHRNDQPALADIPPADRRARLKKCLQNLLVDLPDWLQGDDTLRRALCSLFL
ncbi:MAG: hypothetical protein AAF840_07490, partial [Bacteroidota bacterium]